MREEFVTPPTEEETNQGMAESARKTDLEIAVRAELRDAAKSGFKLTDGEALQNVYNRIDVDGLEVVMPRFARITGRMTGAEYEGDSIPRRQRTYQSSPISEAPVQPNAGSVEAELAGAMTDYSRLTQQYESNPTPELQQQITAVATFIKARQPK